MNKVRGAILLLFLVAAATIIYCFMWGSCAFSVHKEIPSQREQLYLSKKTLLQTTELQRSQPKVLTTGTAVHPIPTEPNIELLQLVDLPISSAYSWTSVDNENNTRLYSAYLDERQERPSVFILGLHNQTLSTAKFYCAFQYANKTTECLNEPATWEYLNHGDEKPGLDSWAFAVTCYATPRNTSPSYVLVSMEKNCHPPASEWIPISRMDSQEKKAAFGVCVETPVFGSRATVSHIVEGIERNLALGAEWLTVYMHSGIPSETVKALKHYEEQGILEVVDFKLTTKDVQNSHYYAEAISITDCLYRNMYKVEYLTFTDLDEIIVPQKHSNWSEMMAGIDQQNTSTFVFSHTAFIGVKPNTLREALTPNWTCGSESKDSQMKKKPLPVYIRHNYRSPPYPYYKEQSVRTKVIVKPAYVRTMAIHTSNYLLEDTLRLTVPHDVGLLYHYREPPLCQRCTNVLSRDDRIHNLLPDLFTQIRNKICQFV